MEAAHSIHFHKSKWFLTTKLYNKIDLMKLFKEREREQRKERRASSATPFFITKTNVAK
jgi:hypothetical protein